MLGAVPSGEPPRRLERVTRYANEALMPFYLIHEPVIVAVGFVVVGWRVPILAKYLLTVAATFAITFALFQVVRRVRVTRFLFGMKPSRPADAD